MLRRSALSGFVGGGKGVDSTDDSTAAIPFARELAKRTGAVVAISGVLDYITDGSDMISVAGGDAIMTRVTGVGCALGALMAAFLATATGCGPPRQRRLSLPSPVNAPRRAHRVREVSR
jgi:hydroxyethylthiazole kinase-like sugar kinase family protein